MEELDEIDAKDIAMKSYFVNKISVLKMEFSLVQLKLQQQKVNQTAVSEYSLSHSVRVLEKFKLIYRVSRKKTIDAQS